MMKNNRISHLTHADGNALVMLANCGNATTATMKSVGLSKTRIENMHRDRLIVCVEKDQKYMHNNENAVWALTQSGKNFVKNSYGIDKFVYGANAVKHNAEVAIQYSHLLKRKDVKEIFTEREIRNYIEDKIETWKNDLSKVAEYWEWKEKLRLGEMSMPDITILTLSDDFECTEIITCNYSKDEIAAKEVTVEFLQASYKVVNI